MHLIQNTWLAVYIVWLMLLLFIFSTIFFQYKLKFIRYKKISFYIFFTLIFITLFTFNADYNIFLDYDNLLINDFENTKNQVENPSVIHSIFNFISSIIKEKISN